MAAVRKVCQRIVVAMVPEHCLRALPFCNVMDHAEKKLLQLRPVSGPTGNDRCAIAAKAPCFETSGRPALLGLIQQSRGSRRVLRIDEVDESATHQLFFLISPQAMAFWPQPDQLPVTIDKTDRIHTLSL